MLTKRDRKDDGLSPVYEFGPWKWMRWAGPGSRSLRIDMDWPTGYFCFGFNLDIKAGFISFNGWPFNWQLQTWRPHYAWWKK